MPLFRGAGWRINKIRGRPDSGALRAHGARRVDDLSDRLKREQTEAHRKRQERDP